MSGPLVSQPARAPSSSCFSTTRINAERVGWPWGATGGTPESLRAQADRTTRPGEIGGNVPELFCRNALRSRDAASSESTAESKGQSIWIVQDERRRLVIGNEIAEPELGSPDNRGCVPIPTVIVNRSPVDHRNVIVEQALGEGA